MISAGTEHIGDEDRAAAVSALQLHLRAGRLSSTQYEDRAMQVRRADTRAHLDAVFTDLPHPHRLGSAPAPQKWSDPSTDERPSHRPEPFGLPVGRLRFDPSRLTALVPLAAVALFFVTGSWLWFLAIPASGILFGQGRDGCDR